ncbi:hypothetical protein RRF69_00325 [Polaribacter sp. HL-MS24]|nr:hypothetical protein [Polaribacter sp. HL-MS24]WOC40301.1 hypothetical protein RRF69_00325 [Polaribacter sp. HL-MS24]
MEDKPQAQTPTTLTGIELTKIPSSAVGVKAIASALSHISNEVGLIKGIGLLKNINQKNGFDCPGAPYQIQMQSEPFSLNIAKMVQKQ